MDANKPRMVGLNHIALEVGDVEDALRFYGRVFAFELRGTHKDDDGRTTMAFIDLGDQFLALTAGRQQPPDTGRHFGLVVDDRSTVMKAALAEGATATGSDFNFVDPWGDHVEIVAYDDVQFSKTDAVLRAMALGIGKSPAAKEELRRKGIEGLGNAAEIGGAAIRPLRRCLMGRELNATTFD